MDKLKYITAACAIAFSSFVMSAQLDATLGVLKSAVQGLEYSVEAGVNIGGASPVPVPAEIRSIEAFNPGLNLSIGCRIDKFFGEKKKWGFTTGIRFENKSMHTKAIVKNYNMAINQTNQVVRPDGTIENIQVPYAGRWTGGVKTDYSQSFLTIPLTAAFKVSNRVRLNFGPYISAALSRDFSGYAYDGYLRQDDPTGTKVIFEGDTHGDYDFSKSLRWFDWGMEVGCSWRAFKHLTVQGHLSWGLNDIFRPSFDTITFNMYPIYLNVGFGYAF